MSDRGRHTARTLPFRPVCRLAQGGMGYVEVAVREEGRFRRLFAVKRLLPQFSGDETFREMFVDEARLAGLVRHPNVVSVLEVGDDEEGPFLVMEYVDGVPLSMVLSECGSAAEALPLAFCVSVAAQVARGLHAAHDLVDGDGRPLGLVHRDVSPQNVLVGFDGAVRLTDFGIAKAFGNISKTSTGLLKGNVGYMAPEQLMFREPDRRSDLFSLGVLLFEMLSGERLYRGADLNQVARRILEEDPPDIGEVRTDVPPAIVALLFELLAKEPASRPGNARDVAAVLETALVELQSAEGPFDLAAFVSTRFSEHRKRRQTEIERALAEGEPARPGQSPARPRRWMVLVAAMVAASTALGGWLVSRQRQDVKRSLAAPPPPVSTYIVAGRWHTCAIERGRLHCWGRNDRGQLGVGHTLPQRRPARVDLADVKAATAGATHTCAVHGPGRLSCWGANDGGQLARPRDVPGTSSPNPVEGLAPVLRVAAGERHTCALVVGGGVHCWGDNSLGQLGSPTPTTSERPLEVRGVREALDVTAGKEFTCARLASGAVCWGASVWQGASGSSPTPRALDALAGSVQIDAGPDFLCAVTARGTVMCQGRNDYRQLARGEATAASAVPVPVLSVEDAIEVAAGSGWACAAHRADGVSCWGRADFGTLGDGSLGRWEETLPVRARGLTGVRSLDAGDAHACAALDGGRVMCWGTNGHGQLGDGTDQTRRYPVAIELPALDSP